MSAFCICTRHTLYLTFNNKVHYSKLCYHGKYRLQERPSFKQDFIFFIRNFLRSNTIKQTNTTMANYQKNIFFV